MGKMIIFDMDGTIADLYNVPNWLEKLKAEDPTPYIEAAPLWDMKELRDILLDASSQGWEIRIISWLAKDSTPEYKTAVRNAKIEWLKKYRFPFETAHLVQYGTTKADCIRRAATDTAILIDDNSKIRNGWTLGYTVDPKQENIIQIIADLLEQ